MLYDLNYKRTYDIARMVGTRVPSRGVRIILLSTSLPSASECLSSHAGYLDNVDTNIKVGLARDGSAEKVREGCDFEAVRGLRGEVHSSYQPYNSSSTYPEAWLYWLASI